MRWNRRKYSTQQWFDFLVKKLSKCNHYEIFSEFKFFCPVWINISHTTKLDMQLNHTMRQITGTIRQTPTQWLPVLSNIITPNIRRIAALIIEYRKIKFSTDLPLRTDIEYLTGQHHRLKSRHPIIRSTLESNENFHGADKWTTIWTENAGDHYIHLDDRNQGFKGTTNLPT